MRQLLFPPLLISLMASWPAPAPAAAFLTGDEPTLAAGEVVEDDLYAAGGTVLVAGTVRGDLVVAGGEVLVEGSVEGDLLVAGGQVRVTGQVQGSIRAAAGELVLQGPVGEDAVVTGGDVTLSPGAEVGRDLLASGGSLQIEGNVKRNAWLGAGQASLHGDVGGDVQAATTSLRISDSTIGGGLYVPEDAELELSPQAEIAGEVVRTERLQEGGGALGWIIGAVRMLVGLWALGALFTLAAPGWSERATELQLGRAGTSVLAGLAVLLLLPLLAFLVFALGLLVGGWWIGLILLGLYVVALVLAIPLAARAVGRLLAGKLGGARWPWPLSLLAGLVVLVLLFSVPILGAVFGLVALLFGLGGLCLAIRHRSLPPASPPPPRSA